MSARGHTVLRRRVTEDRYMKSHFPDDWRHTDQAIRFPDFCLFLFPTFKSPRPATLSSLWDVTSVFVKSTKPLNINPCDCVILTAGVELWWYHSSPLFTIPLPGQSEHRKFVESLLSAAVMQSISIGWNPKLDLVERTIFLIINRKSRSVSSLDFKWVTSVFSFFLRDKIFLKR